MVRRRSRSREYGGGWVILAILMIAAVVIIVAGAIWLYQKAQMVEQYDSVSLCPASGETGNLIILIDKTDPVSMTQLAMVRNRIKRNIDDAETGTRITVGIVSPDRQARKKSFASLCKPPSSGDPLIQNPTLVKERYFQDFEIPMDALLYDLLTISEESASPILENLQELLSRIPDFIANDKPSTLIIFSNLAENSGVLSFYRGETWRSFNESGHIRRLAKSLEGMNVHLYQIPVRQAFQPDLEDFWRRYFDAQGVYRLKHIVVGDL